MPHQPTVTEIRFNNITASLAPALTVLKGLDDAVGPPFIKPISMILQSLINALQVQICQNTLLADLWLILECETKQK